MSLLKSPSPLRIAANQAGRGWGLEVRGSRRVTVNLRAQSVDSTMVDSQVAQPKEPRRAELKGLIQHGATEPQPNLDEVTSGEQEDADLLI